MAQHLSVPPLPLHERMPEISPKIEQVVLRALSKDPKARFPSVADFATTLEQASQQVLSSTAKHSDEQSAFGAIGAKGYETVLVEPDQLKPPTEFTPFADHPVGALEPTIYPDSSTPHGLDTPSSETPQQGQLLAPTAAVVSPIEPTMPVQRKARRISRMSAALLIGLVVVIIAGGVLGSLSLLAHFGVIGTHSGSPALQPIRGDTWTDVIQNVDSFIPNGSGFYTVAVVDQAL